MPLGILHSSFFILKRFLFIDRDGTLLVEPEDEQIDRIDKFRFLPAVISSLRAIRQHTDYHFVLVSNQDGLGTPAFPTEDFQPLHDLMLRTLEGEGITFEAQHIDTSFPHDHLPTRKPGTALLSDYLNDPDTDLPHSYVIGDRESDRQLAENLGCQCLLLESHTMDWPRIAEILIAGARTATIHRQTSETDIHVSLNLDGTGQSDIHTGLGFFDHMLEQIARHGLIDLSLHAKGDLHVDEHHTIEDTALALGQALDQALGDKRGIQRYGFCLPMDDCRCTLALDFGGRPWIVWEADFQRERVGEVPTEMFFHFFKSLSDAARINLHIQATGQNDHHKIEAIFKALARALRMAIRRDLDHLEQLPSTKGTL